MQVARVYEEPTDDSPRVLVDRLWPRGIRKDDPRAGRWLRDVAPSTELRHWYGHRPERFEEFVQRYRVELDGPSGTAALAELTDLAEQGPITLVTATREVELSHAAVLADLLESGEGKPHA